MSLDCRTINSLSRSIDWIRTSFAANWKGKRELYLINMKKGIIPDKTWKKGIIPDKTWKKGIIPDKTLLNFSAMVMAAILPRIQPLKKR